MYIIRDFDQTFSLASAAPVQGCTNLVKRDFPRNYLNKREVRFRYVQCKSTSLKQMCADTNVCIITWCSLGVTEPVP